MLSKLVNEDPFYAGSSALLEAARSGVEFLAKHAKRSDSRVYFSLTEAGDPVYLQRKLFSECFYVMAFAEYSRAAGDRAFFDEACDVFRHVLAWAKDPTPLGRPVYDPKSVPSELAVPMILLNVISELRVLGGPALFEADAEWCVDRVRLHIHPERRLVFETVNRDGSLISSAQGRLLNPGHAIEMGWFLLNYALTQVRNLSLYLSGCGAVRLT